jgi:SAM-dependent methyltransferase
MFVLLIQLAGVVVVLSVLLSLILTLAHYPYASDDATDLSASKPVFDFYQQAYDAKTPDAAEAPFSTNEEYVRKARAHASRAGFPEMIASFLESCQVEDGKTLEVGAGSGLLQDVAPRYVGMDISPGAGRFFHKPFVQASATSIPFCDNSFDAAWSIWVLEHIPNPGKALTEIRRVVKNGGYILIRPAWNVDTWAAEGYEVRPYSDFGWKGKLIKATIPIRLSRWYALLYARQVRVLRTVLTSLSGSPSQLQFVRLKPNYSKYWVTDSDAAVSLDFYEIYLWFTSRGDECLNCGSRNALLFGPPGRRPEALVIRVHK